MGRIGRRMAGRLLRREGQSTLEYMVIIAAIVAVFVTIIVGNMRTSITTLGTDSTTIVDTAAGNLPNQIIVKAQ